MEGLADSAALIGAVNCVVRRDGGYQGENTDGQGFVAALRPGMSPAGTALVAPDRDARLDVDLDSLAPGMVVADVIPNPRAPH